MTATITPFTISTSDPKIDRITRSWLGGDLAAAAWLASIADEVVVPTGTSVGGGRFAYVLLEGDACRFVVGGDSIVVTDRDTRVLALAQSELAEAVRRFPVLTDAWAASLERRPAAVS